MFGSRLNLDKKLDNTDFFSVLFLVSSEVLDSLKSTTISFVMQTSLAPGTLSSFENSSHDDPSELTDTLKLSVAGGFKTLRNCDRSVPNDEEDSRVSSISSLICFPVQCKVPLLT